MTQNTIAQDFDALAPETFDSANAVFTDLRQRCPVAHTDAWGGFWALLRYEDVKAAAMWYAKVAAQGDANAQCNLGVLFRNGQGVAQDDTAAAAWYAKAAAQGNTDAQCNLGVLYENGAGVTQDFKAAAALFAQAAASGDTKAAAHRDACLARAAAAAASRH